MFYMSQLRKYVASLTYALDGKKIVNSYVSMITDKVYDESSSVKSWQDIDIFEGEEIVNMDNLLFKIINKKENIVVFGDKDAAVIMSPDIRTRF